MFKRRRFPDAIILVCVRWYCKYGISYRDLAEMMLERGAEVTPSTIMRWIHRFSPELEKRARWYQGYRATTWLVDETYVKVGGKWKYLFRAVDEHGRLIDFLLSDRRNTHAAYRFLGKALTTMRHWPPYSVAILLTSRISSFGTVSMLGAAQNRQYAQIVVFLEDLIGMGGPDGVSDLGRNAPRRPHSGTGNGFPWGAVCIRNRS